MASCTNSAPISRNQTAKPRFQAPSGNIAVELRVPDRWTAYLDPMGDAFRRFAGRCSTLLGSPIGFALSLILVLVWAASGPFFRFSDSWQLVINTGTTVVTFLMVFLIQATQNRDAQALHLKLDELIRANRNARNAIAGIESCTEEELQHLQAEFDRLRQRAKTSAV